MAKRPAKRAIDAIHFESIEALRAWFDANHATASELWLLHYKAATGKRTISWAQSVDEALAVGWIDSQAKRLDDDRTMQRYTPRRPTSGWSGLNKKRVARLEAEGRMGPGGRAAIESAKANGTWTLLDDVEALVVPDDLAAAFEEHPGSRETWSPS